MTKRNVAKKQIADKAFPIYRVRTYRSDPGSVRITKLMAVSKSRYTFKLVNGRRVNQISEGHMHFTDFIVACAWTETYLTNQIRHAEQSLNEAKKRLDVLDKTTEDLLDTEEY